MLPLRGLFSAEWQTSREWLSFQSRQIGKEIFAEAELLPAAFLTLLHMYAEFVPPLIIAGSKLLGREGLLFGDDGSHDANRTPDHDTRNGSPSACGSSLMDPCHPKALFQIVVRARQSLDVIAMKETGGEVIGDVTKMLNGLAQRFHVSFLLLHLTNVCQVALTNVRAAVLLVISQDLSRLMHQPVGALQ